jgi:hypothetical protein
VSFRPMTRTAATSAVVAILASLICLGAFTRPAFASGSTNGSQVSGSALPIGAYASGKPFSSGQVIEVKIPANSVLPPLRSVNILECSTRVLQSPSATQGLAECDGLTIQGDTVLVHSDGSVDYKNYTVYALPDHKSLGESPTGSPVCNATKKCVLYVGTDQTDIPKSKYFVSQTFNVAPNATDSGDNPGSGGSDTSSGSSVAVIIITIVVVLVVAGAAFGLWRRGRRPQMG